jgi:hypothetical protein
MYFKNNRFMINFKLTQEEKDLSRKLFGGKLMKLIIANGAFKDNESVFENVIYFPETKLSFLEMYSFVENLSNDTDILEPVIIITNSIQFITSFPKSLCRLAKRSESELILEPLINETFCSNYCDIIRCFGDSQSTYSTISYKYVKNLIERVEKEDWKSDENEKSEIMEDIELIADQIIYFSLYKKLGIEKRRVEI